MTSTLIGQTFGRLTVIAAAGRDRHRNRLWRCRCSCGGETVTRGFTLKSGHATSCGCYMREVNGERIGRESYKHGSYANPEYAVWAQMKQRCTNPAHKHFPDYGGRGIRVCDRWLSSFENFLADMGPRPSPRHTIERRDNGGPYSPENCSWETYQVQRRNRRDGLRLVEYQGATLCLVDWSHRLGLPYKTLHARLAHGWDIERAFTTPLRRWH